jgi:hypothetical protein
MQLKDLRGLVRVLNEELVDFVEELVRACFAVDCEIWRLLDHRGGCTSSNDGEDLELLCVGAAE